MIQKTLSVQKKLKLEDKCGAFKSKLKARLNDCRSGVDDWCGPMQ